MQIMPLCYLHLVAASRSYTCPQDGLDTVLRCTYMHRSCAHVKVALLLHPAPTCADGCWCLVPLTFSNLRWWCFSFQQLAQTLYLHLWWLPSATCAGGLFPNTTCAHSNLHCVVVVLYYIIYLLYITMVNCNLHCIQWPSWLCFTSNNCAVCIPRRCAIMCSGRYQSTYGLISKRYIECFRAPLVPPSLVQCHGNFW